MEGDKLLIRHHYAEIPPRVEYELTELGQSLKPVIEQMRLWGQFYKDNREAKVYNSYL